MATMSPCTFYDGTPASFPSFHRTRSRFLTEGSLAALMGLGAGIALLVLERYLPSGSAWIKDLTTFDSSVFLV